VSPRFSIVYPTRHRPEFIAQALRILEMQRHDSFEVIVSDNYLDAGLTCEEICRETGVANVRYVRPPRPLGMVENWNHALQFATGDYVCYLTDKMFVLPSALGQIERAIDSAGGPEIVSWVSDAYNPQSYADYFDVGQYVRVVSDLQSGRYQPFSPRADLDRRGRAEVSRGEQSSSDYCRGKLAFGAYRRELVERIVSRYGALFHNISPDYTSMVLGLSEAREAIELASSCVVSINTDISNGMLSDNNDAAAWGFLSSLAGGTDGILPNLMVPGLYASMHNWVAHDFLTLKATFDLQFEFNMTNWLVYCTEDIYRPGRQWSEARIEAEQKSLLNAFVASLGPEVDAAVRERVAVRALANQPPPPPRRSLRSRLRRKIERPMPALSNSLLDAIERRS
jgi:glycosyltransferase involved in cell wall biosynthesis